MSSGAYYNHPVADWARQHIGQRVVVRTLFSSRLGKIFTYVLLFSVPAAFFLLGLIALALGAHDPATRKCGQVALGSGLIVLGTIFGLLFLYNRTLRRVSGLDFVLKRLPMQAQVQKALETMELYRRHWVPSLVAILITLPVHGAVVISATFAGMAFGLPISWPYYWVAVPVIVLSGSIPISPQGAGVMEFFAILLTRAHGVTISQAFALTMSIRVVQIVWNLTGGIFVLCGGYHAPSAKEQAEQEAEEEDGSTKSEARSTKQISSTNTENQAEPIVSDI